ncbi:hypothetical protein FI667_g7472, partial [Globisporangium splendens]
MVRLAKSKESDSDGLLRIDSALHDSEVRCTYPSKICRHQRAVKPNGKLHKLCEFHRVKANANQRRLQERRRAKNRIDQSEAKVSSSKPSPISSAFNDDKELHCRDVVSVMENQPEEEDLSVSDLQLLYLFLL